MKKIGFWLLVFSGILCLLVVFVRVLYPPHPRRWYDLSEGMSRSEVLVVLDAQSLELVARDLDAPNWEEVWAKTYWCGRWVVRCHYYKDLRLSSVNVSYKSYVLPFTRMRNYY